MLQSLFGESAWLWVGFNAFVILMLALDLGVFHRKSHAVSTREAAVWSAVWIACALTFNAGIYYFWHQWVPSSAYTNSEAALSFLTGYLIEKSLSVDNLFVFVLIFGAFAVPAAYQHRVLFWGVLGALVMRAVMIFAGAALIKEFHWIIYVFGAFLIYSGLKMARAVMSQKVETVHPEQNPAVRLFRRFFPVIDHFAGEAFFVKRNGKWIATLLFLALVMIEVTDLVFAVDSIPAIFAVTNDLFIVYTSNIFAILGLRSLYFLLANILHKFHYLKFGLSLVLVFVGIKMLVADFMPIPIGISLGMIAATLTLSVVASLLRPQSSVAHRIKAQTQLQDQPVP